MHGVVSTRMELSTCSVVVFFAAQVSFSSGVRCLPSISRFVWYSIAATPHSEKKLKAIVAALMSGRTFGKPYTLS